MIVFFLLQLTIVFSIILSVFYFFLSVEKTQKKCIVALTERNNFITPLKKKKSNFRLKVCPLFQLSLYVIKLSTRTLHKQPVGLFY